MLLSHLLTALPEARVTGPVAVEIGQIECDSRTIEAGDIFVALRGGEEEDRHQYLDQAVAKGARAVVVEDAFQGPVTCIQVLDCRLALARLAARFYDFPDRRLHLLGITGTNGKTTTALLLRQMLVTAGWPCGYIGTLGFQDTGALEAGANTTPEAHQLQAYLQRLVGAGCRAVALEVSSHGLALQRVAGLQFQVGVFTNMTRDHLDFHGSQEAYGQAKARLFEMLAPQGRAAINIDDEFGRSLCAKVRAPVFSFGRHPQAQVRLIEEEATAAGMRLHLQTPVGALTAETRLIGRFNQENILAAVAAGLALGLEGEAIERGIGALVQVPGRFERVRQGQDFEVVVDYAHTPDALARVLQAARGWGTGHLLCVFGCGGDRDPGKRPLMGQVAESAADRVILTSDNPRSEDPEAILAQIAQGMTGSQYEVIAERRQAIVAALAKAAPGDVVVIAGKGHEDYQEIDGQRLPFDDRQVARQALAQMGV
ncbi:MAG: UDP-N-acetylmuramoyl-L-alanyl-D-glutamate--2,6-diaminopimelate ligase [Candidatus Latescibacteria bacterium]|nr:UDP-N-acetylmuramoyl-L-alanyl-D-glutamate--2,6-diaminopimelate ligase [Candidatus Latescibacterota bacterium]